MKLASSIFGQQPQEGEKRCLNSELWHACAGPLMSLPAVGSHVVYFPQGHSEQVAASMNKKIDAQIPNYPNLPPQLFCYLHNVTLHADIETDEVYAQMTLQPLNPQERKESYLGPDLDALSRQPTNYFCKTLTPSDTSTHGGFSIPRRAAEKVFPPLDFTQQPPAEEIVARDLHDTEWKFRHIYRGQPKRHLLTTGWSMFASAKRLLAGDSVLFIRNEKGQLLLGIRRANRAQTVIMSSVLSSDSMHIGVLAAAAHAAATNSRFIIFYNPRASPSNFVIPLSKYEKAVHHLRVSVGMRFRMPFETEDSSVRRYTGTIIGIGDLDPIRWKNSQWHSIKVGWDESTTTERQSRVSLWEIEPLTTFLMYPSLYPLRPKYPWPQMQGVPSLYGNNDDADCMRKPFMLMRGDNGEASLQCLNLQGMNMDPWMQLQQRCDSSMPGIQSDVYRAMAAAALQEIKSTNPSKQLLQFQQQQHVQCQQLQTGQQPQLQGHTIQQSQKPQQHPLQQQFQNLQQHQQQDHLLQQQLQQQSLQHQILQQQLQTSFSEQHSSLQQQCQQQMFHSSNIGAFPQFPPSQCQSSLTLASSFCSQPIFAEANVNLSSTTASSSTPHLQSILGSLASEENSHYSKISKTNQAISQEVVASLSGPGISQEQQIPSASWLPLKKLTKNQLVSCLPTGPVEASIPSGGQCFLPQADSIGQSNISPQAMPLNQFTIRDRSLEKELDQSDSQSHVALGVNIDGPSLIIPSMVSNSRNASNASDAVSAFSVANLLRTSCAPVLNFEFNSRVVSSGGMDECGNLQHSANMVQMNPPTRTFTKVYKLGSVGRSLDVTRFSSYAELRIELAHMFGLEGQLEDPPRSGWQLVFVDKENDVLLLGDDPWEEFVNNVQCIKVLSPPEVLQMSQEGMELLSTIPTKRQTSSGSEECITRQDFQTIGSLEY